LRLRLREAAAADPPRTVEKQEDSGDLPQQNRPRQRQMADADGECDELVEDGGLKLEAEEFRIMRKQGRIEIPLDRRQVKRVVFKARMVAHQEDGKHGERGQQSQIRGRGIALVPWPDGRILRSFGHSRFWHYRTETHPNLQQAAETFARRTSRLIKDV
jgi:hypothetical protein